LLLHLHPGQVRTDELKDFDSIATTLAAKNKWLGVEKPIGFGWKAQDLNPAGVAGNAARADAGRGAVYLAHIAASLAELLAEIAATPLGIIADAHRCGLTNLAQAGRRSDAQIPRVPAGD
jgi:creatinine amidohydrolase